MKFIQKVNTYNRSNIGKSKIENSREILWCWQEQWFHTNKVVRLWKLNIFSLSAIFTGKERGFKLIRSSNWKTDVA